MNERDIFIGALQTSGAAERRAYLDEACGTDVALRQQIEGLLQAHENAGSFLDPSIEAVAATGNPPVTEGPGTVIGPYKLLQQIGEGGMGTVYMAEQTQPVQRKVALKIIKAGMDSRQVIARFEAERQALAMMDHVNIARVLDAGATESGRPYFVMELVHGVSITKYCDDNQLTPRERLELFVPVCHAIQHAHQKGIIHRDIKSSNAMITLYDGKPVPKVIDFGVAKATEQRLTERTLFTQYGTMVGTLEYMSPEQAEMSGLGVDTRSDIYSLGVLLYELLTGSTPLSHQRIKEAAYGEILRMIREEEPPKPSTRLSDSGAALASIAAQRHMEPVKLAKLMRGELDWIVMKCLEKDRNRRYETANGFAADLQRYLSDLPVEACPPSALYRLGKFARRNRVALTTVTLVLIALVLGTVVSATQAIRALRAERLAESRLQTETDAHEEAEAARQAEAAQRQIAEAQRAEAETNFKKARQAVDDYFTLVSESKLLNVPGLQPLRKQLLEAAMRYYQDFVDQREHDPKLRMELAATLLRVAQVYDQNDRPDDAVRAVAKSLVNVEHILREDPTIEGFPKRLAGFRKEGRVLHFWGRWPADAPEAIRVYQKAAATWERFSRDNPNIAGFQSDLGSFLRHIGDLLSHAGRPDEALQSFLKACQVWEKLVHENPNEPEYRAGLAESLEYVGIALRVSPRDDKAEAAFRQALAIREKLVAEFPNVPDYRAGLANSFRRLGGGLKVFGRPQEAEQPYRRALETWEKLAAEFPTDPGYRKETASIQHHLGALLRATGRPREAVIALRQALDIRTKLLAEFPSGEGDYGGEFCVTFDALGDLLAHTGATQEAEKVCRHVMDVFQRTVGNDPNAIEVRQQLGRVYNHIGHLCLRTNRLQEAEQAHRQALDTYEKLAPVVNPARDRWRRQELMWTNDYLGHLLMKRGRPTESEQAFRASIVLAEQLDTEYPNQGYTGSLAREYMNLLEVLATTGRAKQADETIRKLLESKSVSPRTLNQIAWFLSSCPEMKLRDPKRAVELAQRAVELAPQDRAIRNTLGVAYYRAGNWKAATEALEKSMKLASGGDAFDWFVLAMAHWQLGAKEEAHQWYSQAIAWMEKNKPQHEELKRFRSEAEDVLKIEKKPTPK